MLKGALKSKFNKNVLTLVSGTTISQVILVAVSPILTRLFSPEDFGLFSLYISIFGIISVIATGRYELAIMIPEEDEEAKDLLKLCLFIAFILSIFLLLIVLIFGEGISGLLQNKDIFPWLYIVPLSVFLLGVYNSFNNWLNRHKQYKSISLSNVLRSSAASVANLAAGAAGLTSIGLIGGQIIGQLAATITLIIRYFKDYTFGNIDFSRLRKVLVSYGDFPLKGTLGIFLNILANQLPVMIIGVLFGPVVLGFYALVLKVLNRPMMIVGKAVSQVFFQTTSQYIKEKKSLYQLVRSTTVKLFLLFIVPMVVLLLFGEQLFSFVFGEEWREAGSFAKLFIVFYLFRFIVSSQSTMLIAKRKLTAEVIINAAFLISQISSLYIGYLLDSYTYSFMLMSATGTIVYIIFGFYIFKLSKEKITDA